MGQALRLIYCKTMNIYRIKLSRFNENDILGQNNSDPAPDNRIEICKFVNILFLIFLIYVATSVRTAS